MGSPEIALLTPPRTRNSIPVSMGAAVEMTIRTSLAARSVVALLLFVGYYVLAVAVAGLLVLIPYAGVRLHLTNSFYMLALYMACIGAAAVILWSLIPRRERFVEPGPRLTPESDPRLFEEITWIARELEQKAPAEVYLGLDVNAWVGSRGGFMGFGSRRIAGVGLALLGTLSVGEFRAVLAHEFGHFRRGDTRLGPWIYKTRSTIGRTLEHLPELAQFKRIAGFVSLVQRPFVFYANTFIRITQAISRRQEYLADEVSAAAAGRDEAISALRMTCMANMGLQSYWQNLLGPALDADFLPPVAEGLRLYVEGHKDQWAEALNWQLENVQSQPHDSHPALGERLKALEALPAGREPEAGPPAVSLLSDVNGREKELFVFMNPEAGAKLRPFEWRDVANTVLVPHWARLTAAHRAELAGVTPKDLPERLSDLAKWGLEMGSTSDQYLSEDEAKGYAAHIVGLAIVTRMVERGWQVSYDLGQYTVLSRGESSWEPFRSFQAFISGETTAEDWLRLCGDLGISDLDLGKGEPAEQPEPGPPPEAPAATEAAAPPAEEALGGTEASRFGLIGPIAMIVIAVIVGLLTIGPRKKASVFDPVVDELPFSLAVQSDLTAEVTRWSSKDGSYTASGRVWNRSAKTYHFVIVTVDFLDKAGRVAATLMTTAKLEEYVLPGGSRPFQVIGYGKLKVHSARASVTYSVEAR